MPDTGGYGISVLLDKITLVILSGNAAIFLGTLRWVWKKFRLYKNTIQHLIEEHDILWDEYEERYHLAPQRRPRPEIIHRFKKPKLDDEED